MQKDKMTSEEAKRFEKELLERVDKMPGRLTDAPRFQLTGEVIPEPLRNTIPDDTQEEG